MYGHNFALSIFFLYIFFFFSYSVRICFAVDLSAIGNISKEWNGMNEGAREREREKLLPVFCSDCVFVVDEELRVYVSM